MKINGKKRININSEQLLRDSFKRMDSCVREGDIRKARDLL